MFRFYYNFAEVSLYKTTAFSTLLKY